MSVTVNSVVVCAETISVYPLLMFSISKCLGSNLSISSVTASRVIAFANLLYPRSPLACRLEMYSLLSNWTIVLAVSYLTESKTTSLIEVQIDFGKAFLVVSNSNQIKNRLKAFIKFGKC